MSLLRKSVSFFLAILLLAATTGVTMHKHYCMGRLISVAINESASPCGSDGESAKMPCCEDVAEELKVKEVTTVAFDFDSQPELFLIYAVVFASDETNFSAELTNQRKFQDYAPPLISQDMPVLHQSFLI